MASQDGQDIKMTGVIVMLLDRMGRKGPGLWWIQAKGQVGQVVLASGSLAYILPVAHGTFWQYTRKFC